MADHGEQEGVSRIVKAFRWCIEPFGPKMDIKFRSILLPLTVGWMLGFIASMGIPFKDDVKSISWIGAIFLLLCIFFWLMTFISSFVVAMAIVLQLEDLGFKAIVPMAILLIGGFGYGIAVCFIRAMAYSVHGVNGALVFSVGSVMITVLIAFSAFMGWRFGLCNKVKKAWIYLRGY